MITGLVALLTAEATITALVGSRVYVNKAPQKAALPYIIITQLGSEEFKSLDATTSTLRMLTLDIDCKADRFVEAESVANAVRTYLDDYSGTAGSYTIGAVLMNSERHDYEPPDDGSDIGLHVITLDLDVQYNP